jgi:hypothetical protein
MGESFTPDLKRILLAAGGRFDRPDKANHDVRFLTHRLVGMAKKAREGCAWLENAMKLLDVVATLQDLPEQRVAKGQVGTVVEELDDSHVLVEFADLNGVAYAIEPIPVDLLMELKHTPAFAA